VSRLSCESLNAKASVLSSDNNSHYIRVRTIETREQSNKIQGVSWHLDKIKWCIPEAGQLASDKRHLEG
jgi:hypothetical protein